VSVEVSPPAGFSSTGDFVFDGLLLLSTGIDRPFGKSTGRGNLSPQAQTSSG
jgi:hypothetical protein